MSGRIHNQSCFFKFASAESAQKIIAGRSLKWSSPVEFNDPFDHQAGFALNLDEEHFARLLAESMLRVIFTDASVGAGASPLFTEHLLRLRQIRARLSREELSVQLRQPALEVARNITSGVGEFNAAIQRHLLHSRVLCVSETVDNVVMWSHYADQHRGVAFQLGCIDALDNRVLAARQVQYTGRFIAFPTPEEYTQHLTGERPIDMMSLVWKIAFTKHIDWAYEREWRVHIPLLGEQPNSTFSIFDEPPEVFQAMYLGCRMSARQVQSLIKLASETLPRMKVYHATPSRTSYSLHFEPVGG